MEKKDIVLVVPNEKFLESAIKNLNFDNVNLAAIIMNDVGDEKIFKLGDMEIPLELFSRIHLHARTYKAFIWLVSGYVNGVVDLNAIKNFLVANGVPDKKIFNFEISSQISETWLANLHHIEERGADFFVTGNEFMQVGVNFDYIPCVYKNKSRARGGVNLADAGQDLRQSFLTAQRVFKKVKRGTIKFVLIGLAPYAFHYDSFKDFSASSKNLQYMSLFAMNFVRLELQNDSAPDDSEAVEEKNPKYLSFFNYPYPNDYSRLIDDLLVSDVKNVFDATTSAQADLNLDGVKENFNHEFFSQATTDLKSNPTTLTAAMIEKNFLILEDYIKLCLAKGAKPFGVVLPFAPLVKKKYDKKILTVFREKISWLEKKYNFTCVDMFDLNSNYTFFSDMTHLNLKGMMAANTLIAWKLYMKGLLPVENFCALNYECFRRLASLIPKDDYNEFMERVLEASVQKIRLKDKIKLGFVILEAAQWCGEDLYNYFAHDERFEVTVFFSLDFHKEINELIKKDFLHGVEQFKSHGINVVTMTAREAVVPAQDVLIFLTPYLGWLPDAFWPVNMTAETLWVHVPYAFDSAMHNKDFYNKILFIVGWKVFFSSAIGHEMYEKNSIVGMPRGVFSGYPRMDPFFKRESRFRFDWKMVRPNAKKIIWAPHHSIIGGPAIKYATFQWNYQFMYEFAKSHPETSWVVKPHPMLLYTSVSEGVFPTVEAFKEYLQKWDDLPNARVYTGAYYQDVFATSDCMIHDCGSFTAEYQYINRPMIYLTRDTQWHNELGKEILRASYTVDGSDLEAIAATLEEVFIKGNDYKAPARREIFDKYLNYPKYNGMLASEFIYRSIAAAFKV